MKKYYLFVTLTLCILFTFSSCFKGEISNSRTGNLDPTPVVNDSLCIKFKNLHIKAQNSFKSGDVIDLDADYYESSHYYWTGPNGFSQNDQKSVNVTPSATVLHRGMYYLKIYCDTCKTITDSIKIDVKMPQGTPSCSLDDNTSEYTSGIFIPKKVFTTVLPNTYNGYTVEADCDLGTLSFSFNEYWSSHKLEPGIYYTVTENLSDKVNVEKVIVENRYQGERMIAESKQAVYVSYVGNKIRINICDMSTKATTSYGLNISSKINAQVTY